MAKARKTEDQPPPSPERLGATLQRALGDEALPEIDQDNRRVPVVISTDTPQEFHGGYSEVLVHSAEAVDLGRMSNLKAPAPFCLDHRAYDSKCVIGAVDPATVKVEGGKLKAEVVVEDSPEALRYWNGMVDGTRRQISVGARILDWKYDKSTNTTFLNKWQPYEVSLVAVAADTNAGVARSASFLHNSQTGTGQSPTPEGARAMPQAAAEPAAPAQPDEAAIRRSLEAELASRNQNLISIANEAAEEIRVEARAAVLDAQAQSEVDPALWLTRKIMELTRNHFQSAAKPKADPAEERAKAAAAELGEGEKPSRIVKASGFPYIVSGDESYSISRAIGMAEDPKLQNGRELEIHQELRKNAETDGGREIKGMAIPKGTIALQAMAGFARTMPEVRKALREIWETSPEFITRAQDGSNTTGLLVDSLAPDLFIEALRPMAEILGWGVIVLNNLRENIKLPAQNANSAGAWIDHGSRSDATQTNAGYTTRDLDMKTFAVYAQMVRTVLKQSRPAADMLLAMDIMRTISLGIQNAALTGSGSSNQPRGITNTTGIHSQTVAEKEGTGATTAQQPTVEEVDNLMALVGDADAMGTMGRWVMNHSRYWKLRRVKIDAGSGLFLLDQDGMMDGYPVSRYSQLNNNTIIYGDFSQLILGFFGEHLEARYDVHVPGGGLDMRYFCDMGVLVRQPKAFGMLSASTT